VDGLEVGQEPGAWGSALERLPLALLPLVDEAAADWWCHTGAKRVSTVTAAQLMALGLGPGPLLGGALRRAKRAAWRGGDEEEQLQAALAQGIR
jgi:hypothetical protein